MNTQEREQLHQFLNQFVDVKLSEKDKEAENLIREAVSRQPDAAYLLIQRCLLQDQALNTAQAQIAELRQQLQQRATASSNNGFLNDNPWTAAASNTKEVPGASNYKMPSSLAADSRPAPQNPGPGFGSSFLGNVATTAAGVVAGSFLFQGIGNLLGHHASSSVWNQQPNSEDLAEQTIINNYYGDADQLAENDDHGAFLAGYDDDTLVDDSDLDSDWI